MSKPFPEKLTERISLNTPYPFAVPNTNTTVTGLFTPSNCITIFLSSPTNSEIQALVAGSLSIGIRTDKVHQGFGCVFYIKVEGKEGGLTIYEAQINTKEILNANIPLLLEPTRSSQVLSTHLVLVDTHTSMVRAIRKLTLPKPISTTLLHAALEQLCSRHSAKDNANANATLINRFLDIASAIEHLEFYHCID